MILEKDFLYRVPVKNALVTAPGKLVRNPEILVDLEGGEFMHGDILDANSTNKLVNQSVKDAIDNSIENGYVTKDLLEAETSARTKGDEDLGSKIKAEQTRAEGKEKEISDKLAIVDGDSNTEGSFRKAIADVIAAAPEDLDTLKEIADKLAGNDDLHTALNQAITEKADASALLNEVSRATGAESGLQAAIATKATTVALNEEIARAKAAEAENKSEIAAEAARAKEVEGDNALAIQNEESRATTAETAINESLNTEIDRAKGQEAYLQNLVNAKADTTALDSAKADLDKKISDETTRATGVEATKASVDDLTAEIARAKLAEAAITSDVTEKLALKVDTTTLNEQVDTLNAAISAKLDSGDYALKTELPTAATKEDLGIVKVGNGLDVNAGTVSVAPDYLIDMMSYGVEWDTTIADPTCTRIGNPLFHKSLPIQSEYKGCIVKNGKLQYYLNPNDWSKKTNGSPSVLDGTDGDVMIHIPKFYGKSGSNGNKRWVRISTVKIDASWVEIPEMFISAYRNTIYTDDDTTKIASVVSTDAKYRGGGRRSEYDLYLATDLFKTDLGKPVSDISRATMRTYAAATGQELLCYEFYKWIFYWNYVIEYANFNSLKEFNSELTSDGYHLGGLGPGLTTLDWDQWGSHNGNYAITPCGYTNEFGNFSGVKTILLQSPEKTLYANRWRGFENPFGDIWTNLEGIVIKRDAAKANSNVYTTTDVSKYGDDYSLFDIAGVEIAKDGYIGTFDLGSKAEIIPSSIAGSESTYKCDYHWCYVDYVEKRTLVVGGCAADGGVAGLGYFNSNNGVGFADYRVGFRSLVRV